MWVRESHSVPEFVRDDVHLRARIPKAIEIDIIENYISAVNSDLVPQTYNVNILGREAGYVPGIAAKRLGIGGVSAPNA
jgi:hypothetical protein